ncbi:MAG: right-handed parallel beta-helix repeat-containing protein [Planctomycetota bacterium]
MNKVLTRTFAAKAALVASLWCAPLLHAKPLPVDGIDPAAYADVTPTHTRTLADGVEIRAFQEADGMVMILTAEPQTLGKYRLPGGDEFAFHTPDGVFVAPLAVLEHPVLITKSSKAWPWLGSRLTVTFANPEDAVVTGADVDESAVVHTIHTDPQSTFAKAAAEAQEKLDAGEGVRIVLAPGIYREGGITITGWEGNPDATLIIEGEDAIVTGADDWTGGWTSVEGAGNVYVRDWNQTWGLTDQRWAPWGYLLPPGACRSEVVAVDGQIMVPVDLELFTWSDEDGPVMLAENDDGSNKPGEWVKRGERSPADLVPGTFGVNESEGKIYLCPPIGVDPNSASVEVSQRRDLLTIEARENVVLRGITFRHAATAAADDKNPVNIWVNNLLIEDCGFNENGGEGMSIGEGATDITIRNTTFNGNGWCGLSGGYKVDNYLMEGCESSYNNWRGHTGDEHSWDAAAVKFFGLNGQTGLTIRNHRSFGNLTHGFWLDQSFTAVAPITMEDNIFAGNFYGAEVYLEKLTGPVVLERNVIWNSNGLYGINGTSWNMQFRDNLMYSATGDRPIIFLHKRGEESEYANYSKDWIIEDNLLAVGEGGRLLLDQSEPYQYQEFIETLKTSGNVYHNADGDAAFFKPNHTLDPQLADAEAFDWAIGNTAVREQLPDLPAAMSAADRAKFEHAMEQTQRFIRITKEARGTGGPPFQSAAAVVDNNWRTVDISSHLNRAATGQDAWIGAGNQLVQLPGGKTEYAGVPFDIADPSGDAAAGIALRSGKITHSMGKPTPESVDVAVGSRIGTLYVLHGGGWFDNDPDPVGRYEFVYDDGSTAGIDIIPEADKAGAPIIGEWWHQFTPFDNDDARHVILTGDVGGSPAYVYVAEIENPHPDKQVTAFRMIGNPDRDVSVIVLAVSYALP